MKQNNQKQSMLAGIIALGLCLALVCGLLAGCRKTDPAENAVESTAEGPASYEVYYMNLMTNSLVSKTYTAEDLGVTGTDLNALAQALVQQMKTTTPGTNGITDYKSVFLKEEEMVSIDVDNTVAHVHLSAYTIQEDSAYEVLRRAAIAKTLTQVEGIDSVYLLVGDQPVMDGDQPIGQFTGSDFINVVGRNVNSYTSTTITLYFANAEGTQLLGEQLDLSYTGNFSLEEYVMEQLIEGPNEDGLYPTISPNVKLLGVTVTDGTCYVNLDETFLTETLDLDAYLTIYSIVNSLTELSSVTNVRITIDGDTSAYYKGVVNLDTLLERNLDYYGGLTY